MINIHKLVDFTDNLLNARSCDDYCPNGLQVQGKNEVSKIISGVTASYGLITRAVNEKADALLVHHGYFWRNEDPRILGMKKNRLKLLLDANINLIVYHLPLDIHRELGNNAYLGKLLGFAPSDKFEILDYASKLGFVVNLPSPIRPIELINLLESKLGRAPLHIAAEKEKITRIAWCSGAAQNFIQQAKDMQADCYLSGEVSENTFHFVREENIHYYSIGHHCSEKGGVQLLGDRIALEFGIKHKFIDIPNPI